MAAGRRPAEVNLDSLLDILTGMWGIVGEMAPYLLFGFLVAGVLSVLISAQWIERHLGGRGLGPILKAALLGVPLPLCSCGVIPVTASLRQHGASRGATTSFLLSTPQTGVDSILATYALLGPVFTVFRPLAALVTGVVGGCAVSLLEKLSGEAPEATVQSAAASAKPCGDTCAMPRPSATLIRALRYGFVTLPGDIAGALVIGVVVAALITVLVPANALNAYLGGGLLSMLVMMAFGIPIYVCSTASIPIAMGFMHLGASPGAALVFLIAGPATNAATITVVWRLLGRSVAITYLTTVASGSLAAGYALDFTFALLPQATVHMAGHEHPMGGAWYDTILALALVAVMLGSLIAKRRAGAATLPENRAMPSENQIRLAIAGMTCSHCAGAVQRALSEVEGVMEATVTLATGEALVKGDGVDRERLIDAVKAVGYEATLRTA